MKSKLHNDKINCGVLVLGCVTCHGVSVIIASCWVSVIGGNCGGYWRLQGARECSLADWQHRTSLSTLLKYLIYSQYCVFVYV